MIQWLFSLYSYFFNMRKYIHKIWLMYLPQNHEKKLHKFGDLRLSHLKDSI